MPKRLCPHHDKDWRCIVCCLAYLRRNTHILDRAVQTSDRGRTDGPRPPFGSREPINVSALALVQDLNQHGGTNGLEHKANTYRDPQAHADIKRRIRQFRSRCALILGDALAPYPLTWDTPVTRETDGQTVHTVETRPIGCPVVTADGPCTGELYVHADDDAGSANFGKAAVIVCHADDEHEWTLASGGWLRLGVLLGGRMDGAA